MAQMFFKEFSMQNLKAHKKWVFVLFFVALFSFVVAASCFNIAFYVTKNQVAKNVLNVIAMVFTGIYVIVLAICCFRDKNKAPLMFYLVNILSFAFVFSVFCTLGIGIGISFLLLTIVTIIVISNVKKNFIRIADVREQENYYQSMLVDGQNYNIVKTYQLFLRTQKQQTGEMQTRFKTLKSFYTEMLLCIAILILSLIICMLLSSLIKNDSTTLITHYVFVVFCTLLSFMFTKKRRKAND